MQSTYSGTPSGGSTTDTMLSMSLYFNILSLTVVDVSEGEAFTYKDFRIEKKSISVYKYFLKTATDLYQPRFQFVVDNDIVAITLETVPVISHHRSYSFQRMDYAPRNIGKQFFRHGLPPRAFQV